MNWKQVADSAQDWIIFSSFVTFSLSLSSFYTILYSTLHFTCICRHVMPSYRQPPEVCFVLAALHLFISTLTLCITTMGFSMGTQIRFVREDISPLAQNSFQFHIIPLRLHIDWNSLHFQGQLIFFCTMYVWQGQSLCFCMWNVQQSRLETYSGHGKNTFCNVLGYFPKIRENQRLVLLFSCMILFIWCYVTELLHETLLISYV